MSNNNFDNAMDGVFGSPHTFHISVMGTGFTVDTPLKVARYGISSVMSIGDDGLLEDMRKFHSEHNNLPFKPISRDDREHRAKRITAYLNLINGLVKDQIEKLKLDPFEPASEITRYFEMLPESPLKKSYRQMLETSDPETRQLLQKDLREQIVAGNLDVNIMTKVDGDAYYKGEKLPAEYATAQSALRGFAESDLNSAIILSAGMNRRLFKYMATFDDFFPDENGYIKKKIILKVSDYRSALIQSKILAKDGLWVSEYRIESGLNCGGHAFASKGHLMGPILEEFRTNRTQLIENLRQSCNNILKEKGRTQISSAQIIRITVQGGIGTADEDKFLIKYYEVDGTGWGTPFLLVPEATNVDDEHLRKLMDATEKEVHLSHGSPLGVPFWKLMTTSSEETRLQRIKADKPGSPCPKGYLKFDTEFTEKPLCWASRNYQKRKLTQIGDGDLTDVQKTGLGETVMAKSCLCLDLAGGVLVKTGINPKAVTAVCCGPGIVSFSRLASLEEMVSHIYGRLSLLNNLERPHMFITELRLYIEHLRKELDESANGLLSRTAKYFAEFRRNLQIGIEHYRLQADRFGREQRERFMRELEAMARELEKVLPETAPVIQVEGAA